MNLTMFSCLSSVITLNSRWRAFSSRGLTSPRNTLHATSSPRRCSQKHTETAYRPQKPHGRDSYTPNYIGSMYRSGSRSSSASWCSTVCTTSHPSTSSTSASLSPASPPDNIFALPVEVFSSCLAIVSAVNGRRARGRPCDMELVTRQPERSGHQQRLFQAFTENVFIFSLLVYIAE